MSSDENFARYHEYGKQLAIGIRFITTLSSAAVLFLIVSAKMLFHQPDFEIFFIVSLFSFSITIILCVAAQGMLLRDLEEEDGFLNVIRTSMINVIRIIFSIGTASFTIFELFNALS